MIEPRIAKLILCSRKCDSKQTKESVMELVIAAREFRAMFSKLSGQGLEKVLEKIAEDTGVGYTAPDVKSEYTLLQELPRTIVNIPDQPPPVVNLVAPPQAVTVTVATPDKIVEGTDGEGRFFKFTVRSVK